MREYCESVKKKEDFDEQFLDDDAVIPSISAMSQRRQRIWDSFHQDTRSLRTENRERKKCNPR